VVVLIGVILVPFTPAEFRWVAWFTAALAGFWAIALGAEDLFGVAPTREEEVRHRPAMPFGPPPPPGSPKE
jgi:membrane glycosyltransferase